MKNNFSGTDKNNLIIADDGNEVPKGIWYEIIDYSERDYGNNWGYKLYDNGKIIEEIKGAWSSINQAVNSAKKSKANRMERGE